ncbi:MAG TPA: thrombospondin type 3 repeat-containing protein, partial [Candidatus Thermoplasmatota archaeon]|nr:thrombospondin type 3 repeat-containing protein [Candidatus Thermoplasmatota archaeon]
ILDGRPVPAVSTTTVNVNFECDAFDEFVRLYIDGRKLASIPVDTSVEDGDEWDLTVQLDDSMNGERVLEARWFEDGGKRLLGIDRVKVTVWVMQPRGSIEPAERKAGPVDVQGFPDTDGDGVRDLLDNCPRVANADQADLDKDGIGDACDPDIDGDGWSNERDNCPRTVDPDRLDNDLDGLGDVCDEDDDNDGVKDQNLARGEVADNCPFTYNPDQLDLNGDGRGDACDGDFDMDGCLDIFDHFPQNPAECQDLDGDGIGDARDDDDDGDGIPDSLDADPRNAAHARSERDERAAALANAVTTDRLGWVAWAILGIIGVGALLLVVALVATRRKE